jgi:hypothetical protein
MLRKALYFAVLAILGTVVTGCVSLEGRKGTLSGTVTDSKTNSALDKVQVTVGDKSGITDSNGEYRIEGLEVKNYKVTAKKSRYEEYSSEVEIKEGENIHNINLTLATLGINAQISDCGGFDTVPEGFRLQQKVSQCRYERLIWRYDQGSQTVKFLNKNVLLNCCGERSITVTLNEETNVYIIDEIDEIESKRGARCKCSCSFDFKIDLPNIPSGTIEVELYRHVTDQGPRSIVWKGELDLGNGEGDELVKEYPGLCIR